jgi:hypothetical protein
MGVRASVGWQVNRWYIPLAHGIAECGPKLLRPQFMRRKRSGQITMLHSMPTIVTIALRPLSVIVALFLGSHALPKKA